MSWSSALNAMRGSRSIAVLTLICLVAGASLSITHHFTEDKIREAEKAETERALSEIFPSAEFIGENGYYKAMKNGEFIGYAAIVEGKGYGGTIKMAIGICLDETIKRVRVISQSETPGLGSRVAEDEFLIQFEGKNLEELKLRGEGGEIDAITGATISSDAVVDIVREEFQKLVEVLEGAKG